MLILIAPNGRPLCLVRWILGTPWRAWDLVAWGIAACYGAIGFSRLISQDLFLNPV